MLTWSIWTSCPQPRFHARDLHALLTVLLQYGRSEIVGFAAIYKVCCHSCCNKQGLFPVLLQYTQFISSFASIYKVYFKILLQYKRSISGLVSIHKVFFQSCCNIQGLFPVLFQYTRSFPSLAAIYKVFFQSCCNIQCPFSSLLPMYEG